MPIKFACNKCGKAYSVPEKMAGKRARCKVCQEMLEVPNVEASSKAKIAGDDPLGLGNGEISVAPAPERRSIPHPRAAEAAAKFKTADENVERTFRKVRDSNLEIVPDNRIALLIGTVASSLMLYLIFVGVIVFGPNAKPGFNLVFGISIKVWYSIITTFLFIPIPIVSWHILKIFRQRWKDFEGRGILSY